MNPKTVLILGGYGNTGRPLARLLLQESDVRLKLAGRNLAKAHMYAVELNRDFEGDRVLGEYADASNIVSLKQAFDGVDIVVVASSTTQFAQQIATTALEAGIDYFDLQYSLRKVALLKSMANAIQQDDRCFITDGGFHPGLPAFMVRYVARYFDQLISARVGSVIKVNWKGLELGDSAIYELVELINDFEMTTFKAGSWKKASMFSLSDYLRMDFGAEFGKQTCAPMMLDEMRILPELFPALNETGFYVGSFNWFVDWLIMPVAMVATKIWRRSAIKQIARWMHWGLKRFSKPPYGTLLKVEAMGEKESKSCRVELTIAHPDGYMFTAIPVTACLLQYLDGSIVRPGVWLQALAVEPDRFMRDMQRMGIKSNKVGGGGDEMEPG